MVFEFGDDVAELDVFASCENFVAEFEGAERCGGEGRDAGRDFWVGWRDPCLACQRNAGSDPAEDH